MQLHIGTSGFGYKEWKGKFYPDDLATNDMLRYYAERFSAVEINHTFRRMPNPELLKEWARDVPADFVFALKAHQRITHLKRLKDAGETLSMFLEIVKTLKRRLGPILFQLPPNMKKDAGRLSEFLKTLPPRRKFAFEFRNDSWFDDEIFELLRDRRVALCIAEGENDIETPPIPTADWGYLRLRRLDYTGAQLKRWATQILEQNWSDAYVFFKHEETAVGPQFALKFQKLASQAKTLAVR